MPAYNWKHTVRFERLSSEAKIAVENAFSTSVLDKLEPALETNASN